MFTAEQAHAASMILIPDQDKYKAYLQHREACKGMEQYGVPYRVYLDYLKGADKILGDNRCYIKINRLYPAPGFKADEIKGVCPDDFKAREEQEQTESSILDEGNYKYENLKPDIQKEIQRMIDPIETWKCFDEKWQYYFLHFFKGYDFESFSEFDFQGTNGQISSADVGLFRSVYSRFREMYEANPDDYMNEEPTISISDYAMYRNDPFILCTSREEVEARKRIIDRHNRGHEYTNEEFAYVFGINPSTSRKQIEDEQLTGKGA